ncbi:MAG: response regulator [Planctomycetales bacterium]|nr:response regulator [Planctomycetales bacterium]
MSDLIFIARYIARNPFSLSRRWFMKSKGPSQILKSGTGSHLRASSATQALDDCLNLAEQPQFRRLMIVDDDSDIRRLLARVFAKEPDLEIASVSSGEQAIEMSVDQKPDVILLNLGLPGINGYETCKRLKAREDAANIIIVSARSSEREQQLAFECGADDYLVKPFNIPEIISRVHVHFRLRQATRVANEAREAISNQSSRVRDIVSARMRETIAMQELALFTLARLVERRDDDTGNHVMRVQTYAGILAKELAVNSEYAYQIDDAFLDDLRRSTPLHDIGKVAISDSILRKPTKLSREEFETMQTHVTIGGDLLDEAIGSSEYGGFMKMAAEIARYHHERFDGTGYAEGLAGTEIPLSARIVALADVYDALTTERPYKPAYPVHRARELILAQRGKHFDPVIIEAFERCLPKFVDVSKRLRDSVLRETKLAPQALLMT